MLHKTAETLAAEAGLKSFDYAVPFDWMMKGIKLTGLNMGIVVWSYDNPGVFGEPVALDDEGKLFLAAYTAADHRDRCFGDNARCGHSLAKECEALSRACDAAIEEMKAKAAKLKS